VSHRKDKFVDALTKKMIAYNKLIILALNVAKVTTKQHQKIQQVHKNHHQLTPHLHLHFPTINTIPTGPSGHTSSPRQGFA